MPHQKGDERAFPQVVQEPHQVGDSQACCVKNERQRQREQRQRFVNERDGALWLDILGEQPVATGQGFRGQQGVHFSLLARILP
jgi:hypothetical protein